jgi:predicted small lipoprotein YifL
MSSSTTYVRTAIAASALVFALTACGRRGALEAPPDPAAAAAGPSAEQQSEGTVPSPVGTPRRSNAKQGYVIPKKPFVLDPLL